MRNRTKQSGFVAVELAIVVVVFAGIAGVGYWVYSKHATPSSPPASSAVTSSQSLPPASNVSAAPQIKSTADLNTALNTLNENNPATANSSDSSQLSSQSNF